MHQSRKFTITVASLLTLVGMVLCLLGTGLTQPATRRGSGSDSRKWALPGSHRRAPVAPSCRRPPPPLLRTSASTTSIGANIGSRRFRRSRPLHSCSGTAAAGLPPGNRGPNPGDAYGARPLRACGKKEFPQPAPSLLSLPVGREVKESSASLRLRSGQAFIQGAERLHLHRPQAVFFPHPAKASYRALPYQRGGQNGAGSAGVSRSSCNCASAATRRRLFATDQAKQTSK